LRRHQKLASKPGLCQYLPQPIDAPWFGGKEPFIKLYMVYKYEYLIL
jgi:hypothetical protein